MERWIDRVVSACIQNNYVTEDQAPWLQYAIEKRVTIFLVAIPFCLLGICISSVETAVAFLLSFYFLRERTSGIHSRSVWVCLGSSLLLEVLFLGILPTIMSKESFTLSVLLSSGFIFLFAPFRCPYINFTDVEASAAAVGAKVRTIILLFIYFALNLSGFSEAASGIAYGIVMAAFLLVIAYIKSKERST